MGKLPPRRHVAHITCRARRNAAVAAWQRHCSRGPCIPMQFSLESSLYDVSVRLLMLMLSARPRKQCKFDTRINTRFVNSPRSQLQQEAHTDRTHSNGLA
ncbi:hypothetical protein ACLKA7_009293 [Drosophila subpalustris]